MNLSNYLRAIISLSAITVVFALLACSSNTPDINQIPIDLTPPSTVTAAAAPGKRVKQTAPEYKDTDVYHTLYLPMDWKSGERYPVIVEYAGNGPYSNKYGDICTGKVDDCSLGYGISGGKGFIWICLPYISKNHQHNQLQWWGDVEATVQYAKTNVPRLCEDYGGDPSAVFLAGFSRGAIACNYIGLHDDEIADLWLAFIVHSHYDGVRTWPYDDDKGESAIDRLKRLRGKAQFISHEVSVKATQDFLKSTGIEAPFTFLSLPYRNHTDTWVLRDCPERQILRNWVDNVLKSRTETH